MTTARADSTEAWKFGWESRVRHGKQTPEQITHAKRRNLIINVWRGIQRRKTARTRPTLEAWRKDAGKWVHPA